MNQDELQSRVQELQTAATEIQGEAVAEDHSVTLRVGMGGKIKAMEFNHRAFDRKGNELGEEIVKTYNKALAEADRQMKEAQIRILGGDLAASVGQSQPDVEEIRARLAAKGDE